MSPSAPLAGSAIFPRCASDSEQAQFNWVPMTSIPALLPALTTLGELTRAAPPLQKAESPTVSMQAILLKH